MKYTIKECILYKLRNYELNLQFVEEEIDIPFSIKRVYFLTSLRKGSFRGAHAHKNLFQLLVMNSGSIKISLNDSINNTSYVLKATEFDALFITPLIWRDIEVLEDNTSFTVIASEKYSECDYLRDKNEFIQYVNKRDK